MKILSGNNKKVLLQISVICTHGRMCMHGRYAPEIINKPLWSNTSLKAFLNSAIDVMKLKAI